MSTSEKNTNATPPAGRPFTGDEYLESLRDGREVYIYGERVKDVTTHPAFRNSARMLARLYDALHDPDKKDVLTTETDTGSGGFTHKFFRASKSSDDLVAAKGAIEEWARMTYGWMGRSPDYKASFLSTLGANAEFYGKYNTNALSWYKRAQEQVLYLNHAIVNPPVDRQRPPDEVEDVFVHATKETDAGIYVSGAKVVATGSALTHSNFIAHYGLPVQKPEYALSFIIPMDTPGVKLICRTSYEMQATVMGSPFDYPLSSRMDENDAIFVFEDAFVPWENIFIYRDTEAINKFLSHSGFVNNFTFQACIRFAVKLDFICGLLMKALDATGSIGFRGVQVNVGEVMMWRNLFWAVADGMARNPNPWNNGAVLPNGDYGMVYRVIATEAYPKVKDIIEKIVASGLIYLNSHAVDFKVPEIRESLDRFVRGSNGIEAEERVKILKLLWDAVGTEFGGRHELYERNYGGNHEGIRLETYLAGLGSGQVDNLKGFAEKCLGEYDLDGWTAPDLINPHDVNIHYKKFE